MSRRCAWRTPHALTHPRDLKVAPSSGHGAGWGPLLADRGAGLPAAGRFLSVPSGCQQCQQREGRGREHREDREPCRVERAEGAALLPTTRLGPPGEAGEARRLALARLARCSGGPCDGEHRPPAAHGCRAPSARPTSQGRSGPPPGRIAKLAERARRFQHSAFRFPSTGQILLF